MNALILHPTASTPVPVTHVTAKARKARQAKPATVKHATREDLEALLAARNLKFTTKHTKPELVRILQTGVYAPAAAYVREQAKRKAARAAKKAA